MEASHIPSIPIHVDIDLSGAESTVRWLLGNPELLGEAVMAHRVSTLWRFLPPDLSSRMDRCLSAALEKVDSQKSRYVFFRADDVAVPGANFVRLMDLFTRYRAPLCLAVVPAWLTQARWRHLKRIGQKAPSLWCWHQHGWRHVNHEPEGKKQEFGPSRPSFEDSRRPYPRERSPANIDGGVFFPRFLPLPGTDVIKIPLVCLKN